VDEWKPLVEVARALASLGDLKALGSMAGGVTENKHSTDVEYLAPPPPPLPLPLLLHQTARRYDLRALTPRDAETLRR
jgi:hypothetical protein